MIQFWEAKSFCLPELSGWFIEISDINACSSDLKNILKDTLYHSEKETQIKNRERYQNLLEWLKLEVQ